MTPPSEERPDRNLPPRPPAPSDASLPPPPPAERPLPAAERPLPAAPAGRESLPVTTGERPPAPGTGAVTPDRQPFTRIRAAWLGVWAGIVVVVFLIIFIGQNTAPIKINFLWMDGEIPTALALLIAGVGGAIIALAVGAARILQLRRMMRREGR